MSVSTVKNNLQVMIGKNISATGAALQITSPTGANYIKDGEIAVLDYRGNYLTPGSTPSDSEFIKLVFRSGNSIITSNKIYGRKVTRFTGVDGVPGQEQIYHIGYVGSGTETIDVSAGTDFYLNIQYNYDGEQWSEQLNKRVYYSTSTAPTARIVALDFAKQISLDNGSDFMAEVLNSGSAASLGAGLTVSVVKGSKYVTCSSAAHGLVAGDLFRIGCTGSGFGTNIPVYEVQSVNGTQIVLTFAYQGPSNAVLAADADAGKVTAGTSFGIRCTGLPVDYRLDFIRFMRVSWKMSIVGLGATRITKTQEAKYGQGDGRQVAELESFAQGFEGAMNKVTVPLPILRTDADKSTTTSLVTASGNDTTTATTGYDCASIIWYNEQTTGITAPVRSSEEIRLYFVDGATQQTQVLSQLNPYLEAAGLAPITL